MRRDIERLKREGTELAARKADALTDIRNVFSAELQRTNPDLAPVLNNIDRAYGNFKIVERSMVFILFSTIQATLASLEQLWVIQAGLGQLPGVRDLELSYCQA